MSIPNLGFTCRPLERDIYLKIKAASKKYNIGADEVINFYVAGLSELLNDPDTFLTEIGQGMLKQHIDKAHMKWGGPKPKR